MALDQIGVLVREGVSDQALNAYADTLGLIQGVRQSSRIWTFMLKQSKTRPEIVTLARKIKGDRKDLIAEAGMTATIRGGTKPIIITDRFIAQFKPGVTRAQIDTLNATHAVRVIEANRLMPGHFLLEVTDRSSVDALTMANIYHDSPLVRYAHPNFVRLLRYRQYVPNDPYFDRQWYLENHGQDAGSEATKGTGDADIDASKAWEILQQIPGAPQVTIAVIDGGFEMDHPDLQASLWNNSSEASGQCGADDDGNGFIDDVHGYDFVPCDATSVDEPPRCNGVAFPTPFCGDGDPSPYPTPAPGSFELEDDYHGTPVAGLVAAVTNNNAGIAGTCPTAKLMLIRRAFTDEYLAQGFKYAVENGAKVISCSWGDASDDPNTETLNDEIAYVVSQGVVILFAMDNVASKTNCTRGNSSDLAALPGVIAVGGSTNCDRRFANGACGDYIDILAPTGRGSGENGLEITGTLNVGTTDRQDTAGYNDIGYFKIVGCPSGTETSDLNYTFCFSGTSASTPIAAGVAGMLLTANPTLTPPDVQHLLQDTADKIEPSVAAYDPVTGFSLGVSTPIGTESTHGYGRVNAYEAVRVAAPVAAGGRGGVDLFVRDNGLDWGNTEQPSYVTFESTRGTNPDQESADIKVDAPDPNYQLTATPSSRDFDEKLIDENPLAGQVNRVYVRVRNRGSVPASNVTARLYWAYSGTTRPSLPPDFWSGFASNTFDQADWHFIGECPKAGAPSATVSYSGCTATKESRAVVGGSECPGIFMFEWPTPALDPALPDQIALLLVVDAAGDGAGAGADHAGPYAKILSSLTPDPADFDVDALAPSDNNATVRDYQLVPGAEAIYLTSFYIGNRYPMAVDFLMHVHLPPKWHAYFHRPLPPRPGIKFTLQANERRLVTMAVTPARPGASGTLTVSQERVGHGSSQGSRPRNAVPADVEGGLTMSFGRTRASPTHGP